MGGWYGINDNLQSWRFRQSVADDEIFGELETGRQNAQQKIAEKFNKIITIKQTRTREIQKCSST